MDDTLDKTGIYFNKRRNQWLAKIDFDKKIVLFEYFDSFEEAYKKRVEKSFEIYNEIVAEFDKQEKESISKMDIKFYDILEKIYSKHINNKK